MTTKVEKDTFGAEVQVGDYLVFATKSRYLGSLGMGRVTKISDKGSISMVAIITNGKTVEEYLVWRETLRHKYNDLVARHPKSRWIENYNPDKVTYKTTLADASTCYKIPAYAVPVEISQLLQKDA